MSLRSAATLSAGNLNPAAVDTMRAIRSKRRPLLAFDRFWRIVVFAQIFVAFAGLFITGELDPSVSIGFLVAWGAAYFVRDTPEWWKPWMGAIITVLVVVLLALLSTTDFFTSLLYLLLFLLLAKCFSLRTPRDFAQAQILSFFTVIATAVITVAFTFGISFLIYLPFACIGWLQYGIARQRDALQSAAPRRQEERVGGGGLLPARFLLAGGVDSLLVLGVAVLFFVFVPHFEIRRLEGPIINTPVPVMDTAVSGFAEEISLGSFKRLIADPRIAMTVGVSWLPGAEKVRPSHLRMRGSALDTFQGNRWTRSTRLGRTAEVFSGTQFHTKIESAQRGANTITILAVEQSLDISKNIFTVTRPLEVRFKKPFDVIYHAMTTTAKVVGGWSENLRRDPNFRYQVKSSIVDEATPILEAYIQYREKRMQSMAAALTDANDPEARRRMMKETTDQGPDPTHELWFPVSGFLPLSPLEKQINTQRPQRGLIDRIEELSKRVAPGPTDPEIAIQSAKYLRENFQYSLEPDAPVGMDPVEAFLFETQAGHCEYFATALVLMLRSRGIPARMVNGYYTTEWDDALDVFIVRQSDAHAWTEVWIGRLGWVFLDATPPGSVGRDAYGEVSQPFLSAWVERIRMSWQRLVIDYNRQSQIQFFDKLRKEIASSPVLAPVMALRNRMGSTPGRDEGPEAEAGVESENRWISRAVDLTALLILVGVGYGIFAVFRIRARHRPPRSSVDFFNTLIGRIEKLGRRRPLDQTPSEFVQSLTAIAPESGDMEWLIRLYYRERYAGLSPSADDRSHAFEIIKGLRFSPGANRP